MKPDHFVGLFHLHAWECFHKASACDFKILLVELEELVSSQEFVTGWDMHHIVHKQSMDDKVSALAFHENCLLTIHRWVSISEPGGSKFV